MPAVSGNASVRMTYKAPPVEGRFVDESLFGDTAAQTAMKTKAKTGAAGVVGGTVGGASARGGGGMTGAANTARGGRGAILPAPLILTCADVLAMARLAELSDNPIAARAAKAAAEEARYARDSIAEERKSKIRGMEAARIAALPKSLLVQEAEAGKAARRVLAAAQCEDATDDMKRMNSMLNQAITVAIRDRQVAEKKEAKVAEAASERLRELAAEVDNLQAQARADAAKEEKKDRLAVVRDELFAQLEEALARKKNDRAAVAADGQDRKRKQLGEAAMELAEKARKDAKRVAQLSDFAADNAAQISLRKERKEAEAAQDAKADAQALKLLQVKIAQAAVVAAAVAEKERTLHLAAAHVSKILDNTSQRDEARQRREEELSARRERARAVAKTQKEAATAVELKIAHHTMAAEKQHRQASMIEEERAEFERAAAVQKDWLAAELRLEAKKSDANERLLVSLRGQMDEKLVRAKEARVYSAGEEAQRVAAIAGELAKRVTMRDKKVDELRNLGVDPRWANQLANMKFTTVDKLTSGAGRSSKVEKKA